MVLFKNADITIYNEYIDKATGLEMYQRTVIQGIHWQNKRNATVSDKGLNVADSVLMFIDKLDNYVSPKAFKKLSDTDRPKFFTFGDSDKVVKGNIDFEITGVKGNTFADLEKKFDDVINIVSITELPGHWEVEGK
jgi:hypothetical protein